MKALAAFQSEVEAGQGVSTYDGHACVWRGYDGKFLLETEGHVMGFETFPQLVNALGFGYIGAVWKEQEGQTGLFSPHCRLSDLEEVINTRTPVYDIGGYGDAYIKLDTDVNGQEWYVLSDDRHLTPFYGKAECWAFPHFNGAYDQYRYEPVALCFKTFADLLAAHPIEREIWGYNIAKYEENIARARYSNGEAKVEVSEFDEMLGDLEIDL